MVTRLILISMALLLFTAACSGGGNGGAPIPNPGNETAIMLPSGAGAIFPAGSFAAATEVKVTESISGDMGDADGYPANSGNLLGATNITVPAGVVLAAGAFGQALDQHRTRGGAGVRAGFEIDQLTQRNHRR